jgi:hypothetical protein
MITMLKKLHTTGILLFLLSTLLSQENRDYIIKWNKDTVFTNVIKLSRKMTRVICEEHAKKINYSAEEILCVKTDTAVYESALVKLKKLQTKHFVFLQKTIAGNLSLYETTVKIKKLQIKTFGEDLIHGRWIYRARDWVSSTPTPVYFYKMENETRENFSKRWKKKTKHCKLLHNKFSSKASAWTMSPEEIVLFYNQNCK